MHWPCPTRAPAAVHVAVASVVILMHSVRLLVCHFCSLDLHHDFHAAVHKSSASGQSLWPLQPLGVLTHPVSSHLCHMAACEPAWGCRKACGSEGLLLTARAVCWEGWGPHIGVGATAWALVRPGPCVGCRKVRGSAPHVLHHPAAVCMCIIYGNACAWVATTLQHVCDVCMHVRVSVRLCAYSTAAKPI